MSCKWVASDRPRIVSGRHDQGCAGEDCAGCQPCLEPHCRICARAHAEQTCAECLASIRDDLREIGRMCDALPDEVAHRGINGEAMVLLGPASNPEARGHLEASVAVGRVPADYIEEASGELHPMLVLGTWEMVFRDHLEQPTELRATLSRLVDYIDRQLHLVAAEPMLPVDDFAKDLRQCRAHLESVLHDGEQRDTGAPCMACEVPLVRVWGADQHKDGWKCPRCHTRSTDAQYWLAVGADHIRTAEWLSDADCVTMLAAEDEPIEVTAGTIRAWATKGHVRKKRDTGRTVYSRADVLAHAVPQKLAS